MLTKVYTEIEYRELDELLKKEYGFDYNCTADNEWANDTSYDFHDMKKASLDEWDQKKWNVLVNGGYAMYSINVVLQQLVNDDHIPEGNILVTVSW